MEIKYHKMSLFDAPKGSHLVHAVNCKGVWGSGIAVEMKNNFPNAFRNYNANCECSGRYNLGDFDGTKENDYTVVNLYTSDDISQYKDPEDEIPGRIEYERDL